MTPVGEVDPIAAPLTYPGAVPADPAVLVTDRGVLRVRPSRTSQPGQWLVEFGPAVRISVDQVLSEHQAAPMARRVPVLAIGSNAAPAQVRRKLATADSPTMVPVTAVTVCGLAVGVSAHVSNAGYVPATPVRDPSARSRMWVTWLAPEEVIAMDATEPNYNRIRVPTTCTIEMMSGEAVSGCWLYVSRHGFLTEASGKPRKLIDQTDLISSLLAEVPVLTSLAGTSPREWVRRTRNERVRDEIRDLFRSAGITRVSDL